jgi:dienelactone hydrolase
MGRARVVMAVVASGAVLAGVGNVGSAYGGGGREAPRADSHSGARVVIRGVELRVPGQHGRVSAYVVKPAGKLPHDSAAGVLFLHWLGQIHSDRTEYLGEAVGLARQGVVSVLPQGYFPWVANPDGTANDVTLVQQQVAAMERALDTLAGTRGVDPKRIAVVGHDYGAMYGALLADQDKRVSTLVLETPDSLWGNWFATYWLGLEGADRATYLALFAGLDPVDHTARLGRHVLFQWAGRDNFVTPEVRAAFAVSSPKAKVLFYERSDHQLTDAAQLDRDTFLADELHLPAP